MDLFIAITVFIFTVALIEGGYYALRKIRHPEKREVLRRLRGYPTTDYEREIIDIMRKSTLSEVPWLNRALLRIRWTDRLSRLIEQSGAESTLGVFVLLSTVLAFGGFVILLGLTSHLVLSLAMALLSGILPFLYVYIKKKRRMEKFQRQLPDALDLIARALKAGHAFTAGLKMVGDEIEDPVGLEFEKTLHEINFGLGIPEALKNLTRRVDCPDLRFFIISVIIQRESGGNLAEILGKISNLIRERFKLQSRVQVLASEGKLSAIILVAIPFVVALALSVLNPSYIRTLFIDPLGKALVAFALLMMVMGIFVMKRMIQIRV
ncbi:MAG: type II secretion system F family protein [Thermodesulfobacteriota bacterium]